VQAFGALIAIMVKMEIKVAVVEAGILSILVHNLTVCTHAVILHQTAVVLESLCRIPEYSAMVMELGVMTALEVAMRNTSDVNSLTAIVTAIGKYTNKTIVTAIGKYTNKAVFLFIYNCVVRSRSSFRIACTFCIRSGIRSIAKYNDIYIVPM